MNIEDAVNEALDDSDLFENRRFIDLMTALYNRAEDIKHPSEAMTTGAFEIFNDVTSAVGEFVPTGERNDNN